MQESRIFSVPNMSFSAIRENKIIAKISAFTVPYPFEYFEKYPVFLKRNRQISPKFTLKARAAVYATPQRLLACHLINVVMLAIGIDRTTAFSTFLGNRSFRS